MDYKSEGAPLGTANQPDKWYSTLVKVFIIA